MSATPIPGVPEPARGSLGEKLGGLSPGRLIAVITVAVLALESVIMLVLETLETRLWLSPVLETVVDAVVLSSSLGPVLYLAVYRPMCRQLAALTDAREALRKSHSDLEQRVRERTAELETAFRELSREVEERSRAEEELRYSEDKYSTLVEASLTGIFLLRDGRIRFANRKLAEILGCPREDLAAVAFADLLDPGDRERVEGGLRECLAGAARPVALEARVRTRTGETRWVALLASRVPYRGRPSLLGNLLDITPRKQVEEALSASERNLRQLSAQLLRAQEEERARIARDLHDSIGQSLSAVKFAVESVLPEMGRVAGEAEMRSLRAVVPRVQETVEEVRRISMALRPSILDDLGLVATIRWHLRQFGALHPELQVTVETDGLDEAEVPEERKIVVFRILQEALNNAAKHGGAGHVRVGLATAGGRLELEVEDDGCGFDAAAVARRPAAQRGLGLSSMRERAELSGGALTVTSRAEDGTSVRAAWPL